MSGTQTINGGLPVFTDSSGSHTRKEKKRLPLLDSLLEAQRDLTAVERFSQLHDEATPHLQEPFYRSLLPAAPPGPGQQYAFEVNLDACSGCKACVTACHSLNGLDEGETWRSVGVLHGGTPDAPMQQTVTTACHHCVDPACMKGCPVGAYEKDESTGIVRHLDDQCIGCQYCIFTCPYEVPQYNADKGIVRKCDMCAGRLAEGEAPACVQACPTEAISIRVVDVADSLADAEAGAFLPGAPEPSVTVPTTRYRTTQATPRNLVPADFHAVRPAHIHTPLVWMLVLTQLSVGAFCVGELFDARLSPLSPEAHALVAPWHALLAMLLGLLALGASTAHLGRPLYAFRAILGVRTSWLSREVLTFGAFAGASVAYSLALFVSRSSETFGPEWAARAGELKTPLSVTVAAIGALGVFTSVMLYHATKRRWWHGGRTGFRFFLSAAVLGLAMSLASVSLVLQLADAPRALAVEWLGFAGPALAMAMTLKLLGEASVLFHLRDHGFGDLRRSALLLAGELRPTFGARFVAGALGGIVLPLAFFVATDGVSLTALSIVATLCALFVCAGELLERALFFAALSSPRMPGVIH